MKWEVGGGAGRRGSISLPSDGGGGGGGEVVPREGIILAPTSVDLVGRAGLLADLSAQGLQQAKLEGVGSFAGNILILVEAKVPDSESDSGGGGEGERGEEGGQRSMKVSAPLLRISKRLIERRHWGGR